MRYAAQPADDAMAQQWAFESRRALRAMYAPEEAERRLATVQQFLANRPALAKRLTASGAGNHPDVVLAFAEKARDLRMTPRKRK